MVNNDDKINLSLSICFLDLGLSKKHFTYIFNTFTGFISSEWNRILCVFDLIIVPFATLMIISYYMPSLRHKTLRDHFVYIQTIFFHIIAMLPIYILNMWNTENVHSVWRFASVSSILYLRTACSKLKFTYKYINRKNYVLQLLPSNYFTEFNQKCVLIDLPSIFNLILN